MRRLVLCLMILIVSCNHNLPIATIKLISLEPNELEGNYDISFFSDIELKKLLMKKHSMARLVCFFGRDNSIVYNDFEQKDIRLISVGELQSVENKNFNYRATLTAVDYRVSLSEEITEQGSIVDLKEIISRTKCVQCVVSAVQFMHLTKRYISKPMCVPSSDLRKIIDLEKTSRK